MRKEGFGLWKEHFVHDQFLKKEAEKAEELSWRIEEEQRLRDHIEDVLEIHHKQRKRKVLEYFEAKVL
jgi:hypothetical protein